MGIFSVTPLRRRWRTSDVIGLITAITGVFVLIGWSARIPFLVSGIPGLVAMNPATAVAFIASAVSLWLISDDQKSSIRRNLGVVCGAAVLLIGLLRLIAYACSSEAGIDQLLFGDRLNGNRMAPNTAIYFVLLGSALLVMRLSLKGVTRNLDQCFAVVLAAGSLLAIIGYLLRAQALYGVSSFIPMALNTATLFALMSAGIILARPDRGLMPLVKSTGPAGTLMRRMIPLAVVVHPVLASLRLRGEYLGYYNTEYGASLMVVVSITIFTAAILWTAKQLESVERGRRAAQEELQQANELLAVRVEQRTAEVEALNRELSGQVEELAAVNRSLAQKNQENEMFVYSVSHDLRSPLVNLQGFSQELALAVKNLRAELKARDDIRAAEDILEHDFNPAIHFIQTAVRRLSNLIDALLRLSRAGRVEYHRSWVDLSQVVQRVTDSLNATINSKNAAVKVGELPCAFGDASALEQVFANLIANAVQYLDPERPGYIEVGTLPAEDNAYTRYFVADNGLGIDPKYQNKIFDAFQRVHPDVCPGEGMGLAIVRRVIERHEGRLWVESSPGQGSTFFVELPRPLDAALTVQEESSC